MTRSERALVQSRALAATESRKRPVAWVEWIATVSLALSTVVAATAVSIGIARADVFGLRPDGDAAPLAIALLIGLLLMAMGGLTAFMASGPKGKL
jgi:glycerol uptake facilitator-like aquaporin